jgi:lysozyme
MTRAIGVDISWWDGEVDFAKMLANGATFVYIKASQRIADLRFLEYWRAAKKVGLLRGAYHYLDFRMSELEQAKLFTGLLKDDPGELPPVCDFEQKLTSGQPSPAEARGRLWNFLQYVKDKLGKIPAIYSGYYYWNEFGSVDIGWKIFPFWLAWYSWEIFIKTPRPWATWTFWQYTDRGKGEAYGCESLDVDQNLFHGTVEELYKFASTPPAILPPSPPPVGNYTVLAASWIFKTPNDGLNCKIVSRIAIGQIVVVSDIVNDWARIPLGWVRLKYLKKE